MTIFARFSIPRTFGLGMFWVVTLLAVTTVYGQTAHTGASNGSALLTRANELVKLNVQPIINTQAERLKVKPDPGSWVFASMNDIYVLNVGLSGFDRVTPEQLNRGVVLGMVSISAPSEDLGRPLTKDFYTLKAVSSTRAQLLDAAGKVVLDNLKLTVTRGGPVSLARRDVDATIRRRHFQFSYHGPLINADVCIGRDC